MVSKETYSYNETLSSAVAGNGTFPQSSGPRPPTFSPFSLLGELLRDTLLGRDDGLRGLLGLLVLRAGWDP